MCQCKHNLDTLPPLSCCSSYDTRSFIPTALTGFCMESYIRPLFNKDEIVSGLASHSALSRFFPTALVMLKLPLLNNVRMARLIQRTNHRNVLQCSSIAVFIMFALLVNFFLNINFIISSGLHPYSQQDVFCNDVLRYPNRGRDKCFVAKSETLLSAGFRDASISRCFATFPFTCRVLLNGFLSLRQCSCWTLVKDHSRMLSRAVRPRIRPRARKIRFAAALCVGVLRLCVHS